ncbi:hypothetical protein [Paraburkholderia sartisoli]|uniref:hypothetical protein n=1 Tax=Paraburkholderia sartisoli TaxID=83784 RepID=UPI0015A3199F|nr:hypothetical protein [Paraburkholderia sartisoli]
MKLGDLASQIRQVARDCAAPDRVLLTRATVDCVAAVIAHVVRVACDALIARPRRTVHFPLKPVPESHNRHNRYGQKRKLNFPQTHRCSGFSF